MYVRCRSKRESNTNKEKKTQQEKKKQRKKNVEVIIKSIPHRRTSTDLPEDWTKDKSI